MTIIDFPSDPTNGQTINVGTTKYVFNSSYGTWDLVANVVEGTPGRFIVSSTEPEDVVEGDGWFDSNTGKMFILYEYNNPYTSKAFKSKHHVICSILNQVD